MFHGLNRLPSSSSRELNVLHTAVVALHVILTAIIGYPDEDQCYDDDEPQPQGYFRAQNDKFLHVRLHPHPQDAHAFAISWTVR